MKIGIAAFPYDGGKSGIWNYINSLITNVATIDTDDEYYIFTPYDFKLAGNNIRQILLKQGWINHPLINILWHNIYIPYAVGRFNIDLLHLPAGNRRLIMFKPCKTLVTIHDLSQFKIEGKYDRLRMFYIKIVLPILLKGIDKIVAVSESTKNDIIKYWGVEKTRIEVLPNGLTKNQLVKIGEMNEADGKKVLRRYKIDGDYILYVSRLEHPGKNHITLIEAYVNLRRKTQLSCKLVLAGSRWTGAEAIYEKAGKSEFASDIIFANYIPPEDLPYLYKGSKLFVFPSLYEGFGIPLLEAMACGVPIVCSNVSSMPEVLGDSGLTFDPRNADDISEKMKMALTDSQLRQRCIEKGLNRVRAFYWEDIARKAIELYKGIV